MFEIRHLPLSLPALNLQTAAGWWASQLEAPGTPKAMRPLSRKRHARTAFLGFMSLRYGSGVVNLKLFPCLKGRCISIFWTSSHLILVLGSSSRNPSPSLHFNNTGTIVKTRGPSANATDCQCSAAKQTEFEGTKTASVSSGILPQPYELTTDPLYVRQSLICSRIFFSRCFNRRWSIFTSILS